MSEPQAFIPPLATYRLQFGAEVGFKAAALLAPYLAKLGVSHLYASPYFAARPGSTHGYDVVDHNRLNPELGTEADYEQLLRALSDNGLKHIVDFVPNHVGVGGSGNLWWLHTLEWGAASPHARAFDIDWYPQRVDLAGKLLVPMLGDQYGAALESAQLQLRFDAAHGEFAIWLPGEHKLPINPRDYAGILGTRRPSLLEMGRNFARLKTGNQSAYERAAELKLELARLAREDHVRTDIETAVRRLNGKAGRPVSFVRLDRLIARQHWRVAYWRVAADDINYRRFFNIHELAGLRVEDEEVFAAVHRWLLQRLTDGSIDGVRIDHIDGLYDPAAYTRRLRAAVPREFYLVIEKILASHEQLRADWPVHGTTGYEFAVLLTGLSIDSAGEGAMSDAYAQFTGEVATTGAYARMVSECKRLIMQTELASELQVLASEAARIAVSDWRSRDFTLNGLRAALLEIIANFPVYRTYIDATGANDDDRRDVHWAVARARRSPLLSETSALDFLEALLLGNLPTRGVAGSYSTGSVRNFAMKVQQFTGPVMAKSVEDTAFYRFNRLVALNEVGARPDQFGVSPAAFHRAMQDNVRSHPHAMLTTGTHDTKRGEDARARLAVLSQQPEQWLASLRAWSRLVRARLGDVERNNPPVPNDEYLIHQLLLGSWPAELMHAESLEPGSLDAFRERIQAATMKSLREAKQHSNWSAPDNNYEASVRAYIDACLDLSRANPFLDSFRPFAQRLATSGVANSLTQLVLKLTVPGVPDVYQGAELWDLSLVDPDNRRPVDYGLREHMLTQLPSADFAELVTGWQDGRIKLLLLSRLLQMRRRLPALFSFGNYSGIDIESPRLLAFRREHEGRRLIVVVARLLPAGSEECRWPDAGWQDVAFGETKFELPGGPWHEVLSGASLAGGAAPVRVSDLFARLPVAVLLSD
ncbi:MAG: malto-oligosyltrehalose synthase [Steroidobacteraceae bacterium]